MLDISEINTSFGGGREPKDEHLIDLLMKAYQGEILCRKAIVPMELIQPFSDYLPAANEAYEKYFAERYKAMDPPQLFVYEKDGKFIMSDDYYAYHLYKAVKAPLALCTVIGDTTITDNVEYGDPFQLPPPTAEVIE